MGGGSGYRNVSGRGTVAVACLYCKLVVLVCNLFLIALFMRHSVHTGFAIAWPETENIGCKCKVSHGSMQIGHECDGPSIQLVMSSVLGSGCRSLIICVMDRLNLIANQYLIRLPVSLAHQTVVKGKWPLTWSLRAISWQFPLANGKYSFEFEFTFQFEGGFSIKFIGNKVRGKTIGNIIS